MSVIYYSLLVFAVLAVGYGEKRVIPVPQEYVSELEKILNDCGKEVKASEQELSAVRMSKPTGTEEFKNILHCFCTKSGYFTDDGLVLVDKAAALFPDNDRETAKKVMNDCNVKKDSIADTHLEFYTCFVEKSDVVIKF